MRFGIRRMMVAIDIISVIGRLFVAARNQYYSDRRQVHLILAKVEGIAGVTLQSHVDEVKNLSSRQGSSFQSSFAKCTAGHRKQSGLAWRGIKRLSSVLSNGVKGDSTTEDDLQEG